MQIFKYFKTLIYLFLILIFLVFFDKDVLAGLNENKVIINEIFFDPEGSDSGKEWLELYNAGDISITITNWKIQVAGTTFTESTTFSGLIPSHEYYLVCEMNVTGCNVNVSKIAMQNGGGATDALRITNSSMQVIDEVFYDNPNLSNLKDQKNEIVPQGAVIGVSGESLGRYNFVNTLNSSDDFLVFANPTPGTENIGDLNEGEIVQTGNSPIQLIIVLLIIIFFGILFEKNNLFRKLYVKK